MGEPYNSKQEYFQFTLFPRTVPEWNQLDYSKVWEP